MVEGSKHGQPDPSGGRPGPGTRPPTDLPKPDMLVGSSFWLVVSVVSILALMFGHYLADVQDVWVHNVLRRLVYLPIIIAAFSHGWRGGAAMGVVANLAYFPHAFFHSHMDPAPAVDKAFEMALYLIVGGLTGWLVDNRQQARLRLERSLAQSEKLERELLRAERMSSLGHMAAGLAHEIRNPLASILGSAESLTSEFDSDHRKHRLAQLLLKEINRLRRVVGDFVLFARPSPPQRSLLDLEQVCQEVLQLSAPERESRGVEVAVSRPERPSGAEGVRVHADRDQLSQVLLNLLLNAYQAFDSEEDGSGGQDVVDTGNSLTSGGYEEVNRGHYFVLGGADKQAGQPGRRVLVRLEERTVGEATYVGVGISDNGPGIPEGLKESVFDPYVSMRPGGSGLGLSISNRIVESHGGFMDIEEVDGFTTVWCFLPKDGQNQ